MNRQTAFSNALACLHYLLSMYPDSLIGFHQWPYQYEVCMHVDLTRFNSESIVSDLVVIRLAGSSIGVSTNLRPDTDVIHVNWRWLD